MDARNHYNQRGRQFQRQLYGLGHYRAGAGTAKSISLYYADNFGETCHRRQWYCPQPSSVTRAKITRQCQRIVSVSNHYDNLLKSVVACQLWRRNDTIRCLVSSSSSGNLCRWSAMAIQKPFELNNQSHSTSQWQTSKHTRLYWQPVRMIVTLYTPLPTKEITNRGFIRVQWLATSKRGPILIWGTAFEDKKLLGPIIIDNYHLSA